MRTLDRPLPTVAPGPRPPAGRVASRLWIALEAVDVTGYAWDDYVAAWDDPEDDYRWDQSPAVGSTRIDATCDFMGLTLEFPSPDPDGVFAAAELGLTLDNRSGRWSTYDDLGRPIRFLPGRAVDVWAVDTAGEPWWLFSGEVTRWAETAGGILDVEAFSPLSTLNHHVGEWTPGADGDTVADRLESICTVAGYTGARRFDRGDITCLSVLTDATCLEEAQHTAASDGGMLAADADGTLLYQDRTWPGGRADQEWVPVVGTNVCSAPYVGWSPELVTEDDAMVNLAVLANLAAPTPVQVTARDDDSITLYGPRSLPSPRTDDLWSTELEGQRLADYLIARRADARLRVGSISWYLHDPRVDLWRLGLDRRRGDVIEIVHELPAAGGGVALLDVFALVAGITHDITPSSWVATWETSRTIQNRQGQRWDQADYPWDDPAATNVWGY